MFIPDSHLLEDIDLTLYERKCLVTLMIYGVADAAVICREGSIPTSKIYQSMEKLAQLGLVEIQKSRPKMYIALPPEVVTRRVVEIARERADRFAASSGELQRLLASLPGQVRGKHLFVDLAMGTESHVKRHLAHLATANKRILSYMELNDLEAIDQVVDDGFPILRRIARNAAEQNVRHQAVFGFSYQTAPRLLQFMHKHAAEIRHLTGVRYSGELGHPFHVIDDDTVILPLDHPFVPEKRFASLLVRDRELAQRLTDGFEGLWHKTMKNLQEINFDPRGSSKPPVNN